MKNVTHHLPVLVLVPAILIAFSGGSAGRSVDLPPDDSGGFLQNDRPIQFAQAADDGDARRNGVRALKAAVDYILPSLGDQAPDWAKRIEFEWNLQNDLKPAFSILTIQPLYRDALDRNTVFTQLSVRRYEQVGVHRTVTNAGLGYRRLLNNNTMLVGLNVFFDYDWKYDHQRGGLGAEARWYGFDFYGNLYHGYSDKRSVATDTFEEVLNGGDVELSVQVPYLPWARLRGRRFYWDNKVASTNTRGWRGALEMDLHPNLQVELAARDDNFNKTQYIAQLRFRLAKFGEPVALSTRPIDDKPWALRDMRDRTLDKVRRENRVIVERSVGAVVRIGRGT